MMNTQPDSILMNSCQYTPVYLIQDPGATQTSYVLTQNSLGEPKPVSDNLKRFYENSGNLDSSSVTTLNNSKASILKKPEGGVIGNNLKLASFLLPKNEPSNKPYVVNNIVLKPSIATSVANATVPTVNTVPKLDIDRKIVKLKEVPLATKYRPDRILPKIKPKENNTSSSKVSKTTSVQLIKLGETYHSLNQLSDDQMKMVNQALKIFSDPDKIAREPTYDPVTNTRFIYKVVSPRDLTVVGKNKAKKIVKEIDNREMINETKVTRSGRKVKLPKQILPEDEPQKLRKNNRPIAAPTCFQCYSGFSSLYRLQKHYESHPTHVPSKVHTNLFECLLAIIKSGSEEHKTETFIQQLEDFIEKLKSLLPCLLKRINGNEGDPCIINDDVGRLFGMNPGEYNINVDALDCIKDPDGYCKHNPPKIAHNPESNEPTNIEMDIERNELKNAEVNPGLPELTNIVINSELPELKNIQLNHELLELTDIQLCSELSEPTNIQLNSKISEIKNIQLHHELFDQKQIQINPKVRKIKLNPEPNETKKFQSAELLELRKFRLNPKQRNVRLNSEQTNIQIDLEHNNKPSQVWLCTPKDEIINTDIKKEDCATIHSVKKSPTVNKRVRKIKQQKSQELINTKRIKIKTENCDTLIDFGVDDLVEFSKPDVESSAIHVLPNVINVSANDTNVSANITNVSANDTNISVNITKVSANITKTSANQNGCNGTLETINEIVHCNTDNRINDVCKESKGPHAQFHSAHFDIRSSPIKPSSTIFHKFQINPEKLAKYEVQIIQPLDMGKLNEDSSIDMHNSDSLLEIFRDNIDLACKESNMDRDLSLKDWFINATSDKSDCSKANDLMEPSSMFIKNEQNNLVCNSNVNHSDELECNDNQLLSNQGDSVLNFLESLGSELSYPGTEIKNNSVDFQLDLFSFHNS